MFDAFFCYKISITKFSTALPTYKILPIHKNWYRIISVNLGWWHWGNFICMAVLFHVGFLLCDHKEFAVSKSLFLGWTKRMGRHHSMELNCPFQNNLFSHLLFTHTHIYVYVITSFDYLLIRSGTIVLLPLGLFQDYISIGKENW